VCDDLTQHGICSKCRSQPQHVAVILNQEIRELERKQEQLVKVRPYSVNLESQAIVTVRGDAVNS
jgi:DNA polymerase zeta